jgi:general stress protein 26
MTSDDQRRSEATDRDDEHTLEQLVREGDVAMFTTASGGDLSSRPLTVAGVGSATMLFLVDATSEWMDRLGPAEPVNVSISTGRNDWVSATGPAVASNDPEAITRLWTPAAGAYFDGPEDPRIRVLQVHMEHGEWWSAPGQGALGAPRGGGERRGRLRRRIG